MEMNETAARLENRAGRPYNGDMATLTLEYWTDGGWYCGRLREVPGAISQGKTLNSLQNNIRDAYRMLMLDRPKLSLPVKTKPIRIG